jgi:hypothetical protein
MHVLETYLARLHEIRSTERGTPELSYRAAMENLLNAVGSGPNLTQNNHSPGKEQVEED